MKKVYLFILTAAVAILLSFSMSVNAATWAQDMLTSRNNLRASGDASNTTQQQTAWNSISNTYPIFCDWMKQDFGLTIYSWFGNPASNSTIERNIIQKAITEIGSSASGFQTELNALISANVSSDDVRWLDLYFRTCESRRSIRLAPLLAKSNKFVFAKHFNLGGSHYAYTEAVSDDNSERNFRAGAALCELQMNGIYGTVNTLINTTTGVIRNPDVSFDGTKILFSQKNSDRGDDYHLYEMDYATKSVRQITSGLGFADHEGIYLPDGNIMFSSSRGVSSVDCWITPVANLWLCDKNGAYMRRIGFDQVHTNFPTLLQDGRVIYTRWDYNDRSQMFPQPLFQMNPDGTNQTALYGSNSWFPTTIMQARGIPGTNKVLGIFTGHHNLQAGKLGLVEPTKGREENQGATLVAPVRTTAADHIDAYGQTGELFQYPYPITEKEFLVTYAPNGWAGGDNYTSTHFGLYFMDLDGHRELLAFDSNSSCNQAIPLVARTTPHQRPSMVDYKKPNSSDPDGTYKSGTFYIGDIYDGPGLKDISRGTIKSLRIVKINYRPTAIGDNTNSGPGGSSNAFTPPSTGNASWDTKDVLGSVPVYDDGSALFQVPSRTPVYFQALDEQGRMVQTMRSWTTLQPNETYSCVGCHENKNTTPPANSKPTMAMNAGVSQITPFYGPARGFSFLTEIQPILDQKCISCHTDRTKVGSSINLTGALEAVPKTATNWKYTRTNPGTGWQLPGFNTSSWTTGTAGFGPSNGWTSTGEIWLSKTFNVTTAMLATGRPWAFSTFHDEDVKIYINGVLAGEEGGYTTDYVTILLNSAGKAALHTGTNTIAVWCKDTTGGRFIDVALLSANVPSGNPVSLQNLDVLGNREQRRWNDAYIALTHSTPIDGANGNYRGDDDNPIVNWVSQQSVPSMISPYSVGSSTSGLVSMLTAGHYGVSLTAEQLDKIKCWIDLGVPFCGDYTERNLWSTSSLNLYNTLMTKRQNMATTEKNNIQALINYLNP